jgi:hypothetical protein
MELAKSGDMSALKELNQRKQAYEYALKKESEQNSFSSY